MGFSLSLSLSLSPTHTQSAIKHHMDADWLLWTGLIPLNGFHFQLFLFLFFYLWVVR